MDVAEYLWERVQRFCDRIGEQAKQRGLTEDRLSELLASESL